MCIPLVDLAGLSRDERRALEGLVQSHEGLDDLFRWGRAQSPPLLPDEMVVQDELNRDVILPLREGQYLVYAATSPGSVAGVTVWDHRPSPDELLQRRLADGWQPTPTDLRSGPAVLGHAARVWPEIARRGAPEATPAAPRA
jgi:hypothetical protein